MRDHEKLNSVHCMRFLAAAAVVVHHVTTGLGNRSVMVGAAGVDVFFIISGIVIGLALIKEEGAYAFAVKRVIRVMPMYWLATAIYAFFRFGVWGEQPPLDLVWRSLLLIPHFGTNWNPIYFPAWTLTFEMLFYVVATVALLIYRHHAFATCLVLFLAIGVLRIAVPGSTTGAIFSTGICLEFCAGMLIAQLIAKEILPRRQFGTICILVALGLLWKFQSAVVIIREDPLAFHLARPLELGIPAALLVWGVLSFEDSPVFQGRFLQLGGAASYSIYLTHIITIDFTRDRLARWGVQAMEHAASMTCMLVALSLIVGIAVHRYVELPLLNWLKNALLSHRSDDHQHVSVSLSAEPIDTPH
ncbi:acyltransferase family protein [Paraburkholderia silvatlantica]|nr:acyltransferase [Paraburkholderia silvatlantica]